MFRFKKKIKFTLIISNITIMSYKNKMVQILKTKKIKAKNQINLYKLLVNKLLFKKLIKQK